jgi:hypothetical protein
MQARYRTDYPGEFVVLRTTWSGGKKEETREWVPTPIENHHISGRAACIGSQTDQEQFNHAILQRHRGGLLGSKKLQTYGIGPIAHDMRLDFVVETHLDNLQALVDNKYTENNIVYTSVRNCLTKPGEFYLIPQNPQHLDLTTLPYLAAFDGHQEIFLLGYNQDTPEPNRRWIQEGCEIFNAYSGVKFFLVGEPTNMVPEWLDCPNTDTLTIRDFIGYCDI